MKKIVIIEDDKILREELEILLNDSGYQARSFLTLHVRLPRSADPSGSGSS